jgi:hypothetical protein
LLQKTRQEVARAELENTAGKPEAGWLQCNASSVHFNAEGCKQYVWGDASSFGLAQLPKAPSYKCEQRVYQYKLSEFEQAFPTLAGCHVSTYAHIVDVAASTSPCQASDPSQAQILIVPPYLAEECNWPSYGNGKCHSQPNTFRPGKVCRKEIISAILQVQSQNPTKKILIVDQNPFWVPYDFDNATYHREGLIFAKVNSLQPYYRNGVDVSMPPPATPRCSRTPMEAIDEPIDNKEYFLSFKGQLHTPFRADVRKVLHNGMDRIVAETSEQWDFEKLLYSSKFSLILRGDVEFSYRFNEVVCSGGVPVLVTDYWVPPFNEVVPFEDYGVLVKEGPPQELLSKLQSINGTELDRLRKKARVVCQDLFSDTAKTINALLQLLTSSPSANKNHTTSKPDIQLSESAIQPSEASQSARFGQPGQSSQAAQVTQSTQSAPPVQPVQAIQPAQRVQSSQPDQSSQPSQINQSSQSAQSLQPVRPVQSAQPDLPNQLAQQRPSTPPSTYSWFPGLPSWLPR